MPITQTSMKTDFQSGFSAGYTSFAAAGQGWANAVGNNITSIVPASTTVAAAKATLQASLSSAFALPNAIPAMTTAFTAFAVTVGAGMAPAFVAVPPPVPLNLAALFATTRSSHSVAATDVSNLICTWLRTGTATPSGGGAPINWS